MIKRRWHLLFFVSLIVLWNGQMGVVYGSSLFQDLVLTSRKCSPQVWETECDGLFYFLQNPSGSKRLEWGCSSFCLLSWFESQAKDSTVWCWWNHGVYAIMQYSLQSFESTGKLRLETIILDCFHLSSTISLCSLGVHASGFLAYLCIWETAMEIVTALPVLRLVQSLPSGVFVSSVMVSSIQQSSSGFLNTQNASDRPHCHYVFCYRYPCWLGVGRELHLPVPQQ